MSKNRHIWFLFFASLTVVLIAMIWLSISTIRLDEMHQSEADRERVDSRVRLALWRMESQLALVLAEQNAYPWTAYDSLSLADQAYTPDLAPLARGTILVPSPLIAPANTNVLLNFEMDSSGRLSSPQVPPLDRRALLAAGGWDNTQVKEREKRLQQLQQLLDQRSVITDAKSSANFDAPLEESGSIESRLSRRSAEKAVAEIQGSSLRETMLESTSLGLKDSPIVGEPMLSQKHENATPNKLDESNQQNLNEVKARKDFALRNQSQSIVQPILDRDAVVRSESESVSDKTKASSDGSGAAIGSRLQVAQSPIPSAVPAAKRKESETSRGLRPSAIGRLVSQWIGDELILARRVNFSDSYRIQGCWLHWAELRKLLLSSVRDLLPQADLRPSTRRSSLTDPYQLASLPVELVPGPAGEEPIEWLTPTRATLGLAWLAVLFAAAAVGLILHGALSLSERRAAFVSAVTHELRTPLTTFKMYSEMLAENMVPDPARRQHYLDTLRVEADRLGHLVENVLAFARLEKGSARSRVEHLSIPKLLGRIEKRLSDRTQQAGLELSVDTTRAESLHVSTDVTAVEQILFNLVDNACKYTRRDAERRRIEIQVYPSVRNRVSIRIRDFGCGISPAGAQRLFEPFSKSVDEAAHTAPGVGLGLALSRRLARSMKGDLRLDSTITDGAAFLLELPLVQAHRPSAEASLT